MRHAFAGDRLFGLERLIALAAELPPESVVARDGRVPPAFGALAPVNSRPGAEVTATIAEGHDKVQLYSMQRLPAYTELVGDAVAQVAPVVAAQEGPPEWSYAIMMLASPRTVVPVHFDVHHVLLFQVTGTKRLSVGRFGHPALQQREIERFFGTAHCCPTTLPTEDRQTFVLGPGDGVYIPPYTFHWVEGADEVAIAFGCGFGTALTFRTEAVHRFNARVRALGMPARPPGVSTGRDRAKAAAVKGGPALRRLPGRVARRIRR
jgi:hypothetical protein